MDFPNRCMISAPLRNLKSVVHATTPLPIMKQSCSVPVSVRAFVHLRKSRMAARKTRAVSTTIE